MNQFKDKVAMVTGAASGIGAAVAKRLAAEGAAVVLIGRRLAALQTLAGEIEAAGGTVLPVAADVARAQDMQAAVQATLQRFGRLDIAFNNAGIVEPEPALAADLPLDVYRQVMAVNADGVFHGLRVQIPAMLQGGGGVIVNNASLLGLQAFPYQFAYTASKHAVIGMTRAIATEYAGQGIRCNAIARVSVQGAAMGDELVNGEAWAQIAPLIPAGRAATLDDVVNAVLWLSGAGSAFVHGHVLPIDGGMHVW
jgi:NAD(P)-dependent dehydrogenase (short-subunit alcohol dehydrogenase family)